MLCLVFGDYALLKDHIRFFREIFYYLLKSCPLKGRYHLMLDNSFNDLATGVKIYFLFRVALIQRLESQYILCLDFFCGVFGFDFLRAGFRIELGRLRVAFFAAISNPFFLIISCACLR